MCNFLSAIILKNLDVIWDYEYTKSHEELIKKYNLVDDEISLYSEKFYRIEFIPIGHTKSINNKDNWRLIVDESFIPHWFNKEIIMNKLWTIISNMFIQDKRETLQEGCFILLDGAEVENVNNCNIPYMVGNSKVGILRGSSKIETMWETSEVRVMRRNSKVVSMKENSKVVSMKENSEVKVMRGNSKVEVMKGNSKVETMWENSTVEIMRENSTVETMKENSKVETMWENSTVETMKENSKVDNDFRKQ